MPLVETLTVTVGSAVSKSLLKLWLGDQVLAQTVGVSISELAEAKAKNFLEKRSIERSFDRIAEEIALKLEPYLEVEFRELDDGEVTAAIFAAQETIDRTSIDEDLLLANDLEPIRLEAAMRAGDPDKVSSSYLSESGKAIYDFVLRESSNYIVEVMSTLPSFQSRAAREMLARDSRLIDLVEQVLERLPEESGTGIDKAAQFEAQYRREVARKLDRLELFGVTTDELNRRYALSVAYISLTASTQDTVKGKRHQGIRRARKDSERAEMSVEALVAQGPRSLIRGEAGSGKTTLLQWLAVSSARRRFEGELEHWNDTVPFFIQLRRYVDHDLPQPSEFPLAVNRALADEMPQGWVGDQLEMGRGLVLVDGVDELREEERENAADWLRDLIHLYPESRFVVTSRPPAVSENWLAAESFSTAFLEPMSVSAIDSFIDHWHTAAQRNAADEEEVQELVEVAARLRALVRKAPQIRNLATSPLLCAMLCALNRDRKAQLPNDRVELYRIALEMLLERRDRSRDVKGDEVRISRQQKEVLLQGVAYWLLINGFSDAALADVKHRIAARIETIPRLDANTDEVFQHLLLRSGLLREPVEGRIDFIHRTFQEYLAAKQAVDDRSTGLLVEHAVEDQWQEVIILAAGLGTEEISRNLIEALLDRGKSEPELRHRLHLLAVACLETAPALPKDLQDQIGEVLRGLIPPRTMSEAKAIASAGNVAVPLLATQHNGPVITAAPSARALGLIGGPAAMDALESFGSDQRVTIGRELVRSWEYFPVDEYAERVLADSVLDRGFLQVTNAEMADALRYMKQVKHLSCVSSRDAGSGGWDLSSIRGLSQLQILHLRGLTAITSLPDLPDESRLHRLSIQRCADLEEASLEHARELVRIDLVKNPSLVELPGIRSLPKLEQIRIWDCPGVAKLRMPASLKQATLSELPIEDLRIFEDCLLTKLIISQCQLLADISMVTNMEGLEDLSLIGCTSSLEASDVFSLPALRSLSLQGSRLADYSQLGTVTGLKRLNLSLNPITNISPLESLIELNDLALDGCKQIDDLSPISGLTELTDVSLIDCSLLRSLEPLGNLANLKSLDLFGCRSIPTLEPILDLPNLEWIDIGGCPSSLDPTPLAERGVRIMRGPHQPMYRVARPILRRRRL